MANNERLTKRVKKIEDWVAENEEMGGPKGYLDTMVALINETRRSQQAHAQLMNNFNNFPCPHPNSRPNREQPAHPPVAPHAAAGHC